MHVNFVRVVNLYVHITPTLRSVHVIFSGLLSYRKQSTDLKSKSMDWFLYGRGLHHERVKAIVPIILKPTNSHFQCTSTDWVPYDGETLSKASDCIITLACNAKIFTIVIPVFLLFPSRRFLWTD